MEERRGEGTLEEGRFRKVQQFGGGKDMTGGLEWPGPENVPGPMEVTNKWYKGPKGESVINRAPTHNVRGRGCKKMNVVQREDVKEGREGIL